MLEGIDILFYSKFFYNIMLSIAFVSGIILMVSPEAFKTLNEDLNKEYGLRKKFSPKLESSFSEAVDRIVFNYRVFAGAVFATSAFILLLIYQ